MKALFSRLRGRTDTVAEAPVDSALATSLLPLEAPLAPPVGWDTRAAELRARAMDSAEAARQLLQRWQGEEALGRLGGDTLGRLARVLQGAQVPPACELIRQDEGGEFLLVLLEGQVMVERQQPGGHLLRLGEAHAGDVLGEMALFDHGPRFCACRTLSPVTVAVLPSSALRALMIDDAPLAAALLAAFARRLSLRLRQTGARLGALLAAT